MKTRWWEVLIILTNGVDARNCRCSRGHVWRSGNKRARRRVRVVVLNAGDELIGVGGSAEAWQVRDSNGPLLEALARV